MTPDEVSRLLKSPLMEPTNLPDTVVLPPQVLASATYPISDPVCMLEINYLGKTTSPIIRVRIYEETNGARQFKEGDDKWNCTDYGPDTAKFLGFTSSCATTFPKVDSYWIVTILTQYPSKTTRSIASSMKFSR
jgi:hypothetical protein